MGSTTQRGNYYKKKTQKYYESKGYVVQLTEFVCGVVVSNKCFYKKIDIFGSDGISMNGEEIIFWNSKHCTTNDKVNIDNQIRQAKKEFDKYPFPNSVFLHIVMWKPRQKPEIIVVPTKK